MSARTRRPARNPRSAVGIDLAGSPMRRTGFCRLGGGCAETAIVFSDEEILAAVRRSSPGVVSIDAPLSLPRGRLSLEIPGPPHFRACDLELRARHIPFFPVTLGPMRLLTARGIRLRGLLQAEGNTVIESYPGGAQDVLGLPRKGKDPEPLRQALGAYGIVGDVGKPGITHDELDAITCALVGALFLEGRAESIGSVEEGTIVLPARRRGSATLAGVGGPKDRPLVPLAQI